MQYRTRSAPDHVCRCARSARQLCGADLAREVGCHTTKPTITTAQSGFKFAAPLLLLTTSGSGIHTCCLRACTVWII